MEFLKRFLSIAAFLALAAIGVSIFGCFFNCGAQEEYHTKSSGVLPIEIIENDAVQEKHFKVNFVEYSFTSKYGSDISYTSLIDLLDSDLLRFHYENIINDIGEYMDITVKVTVTALTDIKDVSVRLAVSEESKIWGIPNSFSHNSESVDLLEGETHVFTITFKRELIEVYDITSADLRYSGKELYFTTPEGTEE